MWLVEEEDQGYISYCLYKNKPIMEISYPTERTRCVECANYEDAEHICNIPEDVIDALPFVVGSEPIEIDVKICEDSYKREEKEDTPFRQIKFDEWALEGRTIKDIRIYNDSNIWSSHVLIIFTDNTYTIVGLRETDNFDYENVIMFTDRHEHFLTEQGQNEFVKNPLKYGYINDGEYRIHDRYQDYINTGIIKMPEEIIKTAAAQHQQHIDDLEYQQYLKLKEKYEHKEAN